MLLIEKEFVDAAVNAQSAEDLYDVLQKAIQLEHATVPPYLAAAYSLKPGKNNAIRNIIVQVAEEEMRHMSIVANILNAIGGEPRMSDPNFIPKYPGPLPMSIGGGIDVGIRKFSVELVKDTFMNIEAPERPIANPFMADTVVDGFWPQQFSTIGTFYQEVIRKLEELGDEIFAAGDPARQLSGDVGFSQPLIPVVNVQTARDGLISVILEGEGTSTVPMDDEQEPAHFYQFEQIVRGKRLIPNANSPTGFSFSGGNIRFSPEEVWDFPDDPKIANYEEGTEEFRRVEVFNSLYSDLMRLLHEIFNGSPGKIADSVQLMGRLRIAAVDALRQVDPITGKQCAPTFEFVP